MLDGLSFKASTPTFHEQYLLPFERYLAHVHGEENTWLVRELMTNSNTTDTTSKATLDSPCSPSLVPPQLSSESQAILDESPDSQGTLHTSLSPLGGEDHRGTVISGLVLDLPSLQRQEDVVPVQTLEHDHGQWWFPADTSDLTLNLPSYGEATNSSLPGMPLPDSPITAWRNATSLNQDPVISPTFTQRPLARTAVPAMAHPAPFLLGSLLPLHTSLPAPFTALDECIPCPLIVQPTTLNKHTPSPLIMQPTALDERIPSPLIMQPTALSEHIPPPPLIMQPAASNECTPPPPPTQPTALDEYIPRPSPLIMQPTALDERIPSSMPTCPTSLRLVSASDLIHEPNRPSSSQPMSHPVGTNLVEDGLGDGVHRPDSELVSSLPTTLTSPMRRSARPARPSTRAKEAGLQQETQLAPKRKRIAAQQSAKPVKKVRK